MLAKNLKHNDNSLNNTSLPLEGHFYPWNRLNERERRNSLIREEGLPFRETIDRSHVEFTGVFIKSLQALLYYPQKFPYS